MIKSLFAVIIGGSVGCTLRWLLSTRFNSLFPNLPPGTLVVNLLAGLLVLRWRTFYDNHTLILFGN